MLHLGEWKLDITNSFSVTPFCWQADNVCAHQLLLTTQWSWVWAIVYDLFVMVAANGEKSVECGRESLETLGACVTNWNGESRVSGRGQGQLSGWVQARVMWLKPRVRERESGEGREWPAYLSRQEMTEGCRMMDDGLVRLRNDQTRWTAETTQ